MDASHPGTLRKDQETSLSLRGVLDTALPRELGTDDEPALYTVPAVFSRRVSPQEQKLIEQPAVTDGLADLGFPGIALKVEDRRLLISNTNLAMLDNGLAAAIAAILRHVEEQLAAERIRVTEELDERRAAELARAAAVKAVAERVRFE